MKSTQTVSIVGKKIAYSIGGLLLVMGSAMGWAGTASAQSISYDPYADSVADTALVVADANNAVGAPNGTNASLAGPGASLTLDMGEGEEGTQTLRLHLGQINLQLNVDVAFLDSNKAVISSENRQLGVDLNPSTQNFAYNWTNFGKAYRFVRISSAGGGGVNVDAVEALGYIGSTPTQDTDGDGIPDRTEQANGTDPLVPNAPAGGTTTPTGPVPGSTGGGTPNSGGVSGQVNMPPAADNDQDNDGMADDWERAHGLNPSDPSDASADPDHDKLNNLTEYKIGSDPQKMDTDGDGMPDNWEYENGLDVNKNDADGDPDGDFLTNLGEYRHGTDPHKADDLYKVFGKNCVLKKSVAAWLLAALAVAVLGWLLMRRRKSGGSSSKQKKSRKTN